VIDVVKQYEQQMGYSQHPVGMTMQFPVPDQRKVNEPLFGSRADWISPGFEEPISTAQQGDGPPPGGWLTDPPANDGTKVILTDTDHYSPFKSDALWAWKSFLRGHNPILYDLGIINGASPPDPSSGTPSYESLEAARYAMGDTRRFAERIDLVAMEPCGDLSSTGYALANPGQEYLVLEPSDTTEPFTMTVAAGTYTAEWYSVTSRETRTDSKVTVPRDGAMSFTASVAMTPPVVLYLKQDSR
jgi:hypothetical protein